MYFIDVAKSFLVDNFGPECIGCDTPILVTSLMFQDSKSSRLNELVFRSTCLSCGEVGEVSIDKELKKEPKISENLRLAFISGMPSTDEILGQVEMILHGSR